MLLLDGVSSANSRSRFALEPPAPVDLGAGRPPAATLAQTPAARITDRQASARLRGHTGWCGRPVNVNERSARRDARALSRR